MAGRHEVTGVTDGADPQVRVRFEFVELLFALATAEIALQFGTLASGHITISDAPTAYSHLVLAIVLVAASWVGWSQSKAPGNVVRVTGVFSWAFVVLLIDVALVIFYFIIARGVEVSTLPSGQVVIGTPSAEKETFWVMVVFLVYLFWDLLTKSVIAAPQATSSFWQRLGGHEFWDRGWVSVVCAAVATVSWLCLHAVIGVRPVLVTDLALLALVLLFRALKQRHWPWSVVCGAAWIAAFLVARLSS
jgi:hypothetical protein